MGCRLRRPGRLARGGKQPQPERTGQRTGGAGERVQTPGHAPCGRPRASRRAAPSSAPSAKDTHLQGRRVGFERLHESRHAERQVPHGREQQRGREAADGDQRLHLRGQAAMAVAQARPPPVPPAAVPGAPRAGRASPAHTRPRAPVQVAPRNGWPSPAAQPPPCLPTGTLGLSHGPPHAAPPSGPAAQAPGVAAASSRGSEEGTSRALAPLGPLLPREPGVTYQTLAGTLCCHVTGDGTWKTLKGKRKISEMTVRDVGF